MNRTAVSGSVSVSLTDAVDMQSSSETNNLCIPTSNGITMPGSLVLDGSASIQHLPQQQQQAGQGSVPMRDNDYSHVDKKPRLEVKLEKTTQQKQILQQPIQRQDQTGKNPQFQALLQQQRLRQQQQLLQSMSPFQRLQLQQQQQLRQQLQQQRPQQISPYEVGVCARKLMMYLYHLQQRPAENCITYWRKFVAEYFSPRAKQRLCLSQYKSAGLHALGMFTQAAPDMWKCDLCRNTSGSGFEATYDMLPRLFEIKFASGIIDELLYLHDLPRENRFPSGMMMLEYSKAVQVTVHEQFRVVREGHLRIIFSHDLKILSWEFCARRHEELLLRRLIAPQVNQLLQVAQKCQSTISESGSEGVSQQDLQSNSNMVLRAGRQLAKFMELQPLNDLGYPKRYIRTLQISEVVKSMRDLMNFTSEHKIGPIKGLKRLLEQAATVKLQRQKMQEMEQFGNSGAMNGTAQDSMAVTSGMMNGSTGNKNSNNYHQIVGDGTVNGPAQAQPQMALSPGTMINLSAINNSNSHHRISGCGAMNGSAEAAAALTNYQSMLMKQNAMNNPNSTTGKQEGLSSQESTLNSNQTPSSLSHQSQNLPTGGFPSSPQMQQQQHTMNGAPNTLPQNHPLHLQPPYSHGNNQEQHQLLQEMSKNGVNVQQQQAFSGQSGSNSNTERNTTACTSNISGVGRVPSRNNSFKSASDNSLHFSEDISVTEPSQDFSVDDFFNNSDIFDGSL